MPHHREVGPRGSALMYATFIAGVCSIIYELLIATTASYFLGDSITWFSLTMGLYMAAMGAGSFFSSYIRRGLLLSFLRVELLLALIGGLSIPLLYFGYGQDQGFFAIYASSTLSIGVLTGLEIPLLTRMMESYRELRRNIAEILSLDYLGALLATLAFPFVLLPWIGIYRSSLLFGLVNLSIVMLMLRVFQRPLRMLYRPLRNHTILAAALLLMMLLTSSHALHFWDQSLYRDHIIFSQQTRYQHIVMTRYRDDLRLFLNGNLQFSSIDEYRYHEALIHLPMSMRTAPVRRVLLLGAGDGLAVRELLKYPEIEQITLVDLDPAMIKLARTHPLLTQLNEHSLDSPRVHLVIADALDYLRRERKRFDLIVCDLPDPNNPSLVRLYTTAFYRLARAHLDSQGIFVTQATSPYYAREAFWCIVRTLEATPFPHVRAYHTSIPSFGDWGFVAAASHPLLPDSTRWPQDSLRYLSPPLLDSLFAFAKDLQPASDPTVNHIDRPVLLRHYLAGWAYYGR